MSELSSNIEFQKIPELIEDFIEIFEKAIQANNSFQILTILSIMKLYFEKVTVDTLIMGKRITILALQLIAFRGENSAKVYSELGKFLSVT